MVDEKKEEQILSVCLVSLYGNISCKDAMGNFSTVIM